jgi:hypothetical protein
VKLCVAALATLTLLASSCGGSAAAPATTTPAAAPFDWLHPAPPPPTWKTTRTATGTVLAYPPTWHPIHGDAGTASAAQTTPSGLIIGYLNVTPAIATETPSTWPQFRIAHNAQEGSHHVHLVAHASGLRFRTGTGACVIDTYQTSKSAYKEIACLVRGHIHSTVVVAAATPTTWTAEQVTLYQAIAALRT